MTAKSGNPPDPKEVIAALKRRIRELERTAKESRRTIAALRESEAKFRFLSENMADVSFMIDMDLRTTYVSPSIERILGYRPAERLNQPIDAQITPQSLRLASDTLTAEMAREQEGGADPDRSHTMTLEYYHKDGSIRCLETYIRGMRNDRGALTGFYGLSRDITERQRIEEDLRVSEKRYKELSFIDDLTQLYNSRHFYVQLQSEIDRSNRYEQPLTMLLLDLDNFKAFNDTHGHIEGDRVLQRMGQVVKRCLRDADTAYRYGGEEFTVLLPMTTGANGVVTAERIRAELKKELFSPIPGQDTHVTVSIGVSQYRPREEMTAFVHRVDQLMYEGKKRGKDRVSAEGSLHKEPEARPSLDH